MINTLFNVFVITSVLACLIPAFIVVYVIIRDFLGR